MYENILRLFRMYYTVTKKLRVYYIILNTLRISLFLINCLFTFSILNCHVQFLAQIILLLVVTKDTYFFAAHDNNSLESIQNRFLHFFFNEEFNDYYVQYLGFQ